MDNIEKNSDSKKEEKKFVPSTKIIKYIEKKIKRLESLQRFTLIADLLINFFIIIINIASIILASIILDKEMEALYREKDLNFEKVINGIGMSGIFAALIIVLFILSIFFALYRGANNYVKYRNCFKKIEYYVVKYKNVKEYTLKDLQEDLNNVEKDILFKTKVKWRTVIRDVLTKKVN